MSFFHMSARPVPERNGFIVCDICDCSSLPFDDILEPKTAGSPRFDKVLVYIPGPGLSLLITASAQLGTFEVKID